MKLITRDTDYALRAVCFIAKKKKIVAVSELVKELKVPRPFLRKQLQVLNKKGILDSHRGLGGGFSLALPANKISLLGLMTIFQGGFKLNECFLKRKVCPNTRGCCLKKKIDKIGRFVSHELKAITIDCLLR